MNRIRSAADNSCFPESGRPLFRKVTWVLALTLLMIFAASPAGAQRGKTATRVGETSRPKEEKRSKPVRPQPRDAEKNPGREKAAREDEVRPRTSQKTRTESDSQAQRETRKTRPIFESERRDRAEQFVPEQAIRETHREDPGQRIQRHEDAKERVRGTLERFRRDMVEGDSRALSGMLSDRSRVKITIDSKGVNDSFSRGQAQYILKEYLSASDDRELSFSRFRVSSSDSENAYGVGKLKMRDRKSGKIMDRTVFVSMTREGEDWAIREIRITE